MRYNRVQEVLGKELRFKKQMGDKLESVADKSGETKQYAPEVIAVTDALHKAGRDASHLTKKEIITAAGPLFDKFAKNGGLKQTALVHVPKRNDAPKAEKPAPAKPTKVAAAKAPPKAAPKAAHKPAPKPPAKSAPAAKAPVKVAPKAAPKVAPKPAPKPVAKAVPAAKSKLRVVQAPRPAAAPAKAAPAPVVKKVTVETKKSNAALAKAAQPVPQPTAEQPDPEPEPTPETSEAEAHVEEQADVPPRWEESQPDAPEGAAEEPPAPDPEPATEEPAGEQEPEQQPPEGDPAEPVVASGDEPTEEGAGEQDPTLVPNDGLPKTQEEALEEERRVQESLQTLTNENTLLLLNQPGYNPYIAMTTMILSALQICEFFDKMPGHDQRKSQLDRLAVESQDLVEKYKSVATVKTIAPVRHAA